MGRVNWKFFRKRSNLNIENFIVKNNCATYKDFAKVLLGRGVEAPPESEVAAYFVTPKSAPAPARTTPSPTKG